MSLLFSSSILYNIPDRTVSDNMIQVEVKHLDLGHQTRSPLLVIHRPELDTLNMLNV